MKFNTEKIKELCRLLGLQDLPLAIFYTDDKPTDGIHPESGFVPRDEDLKDPEVNFDNRMSIFPCVMAYIRRARRTGVTAWFDEEHFGCGGGGLYLGCAERSPLIPAIVSTGIEGKIEGERYMKSPELVDKFLDEMNLEPAPAKYCVFKRMDKLEENEEPQVVAFFANPDQISGLVNLLCFSLEDWNSVSTPFGAACTTLVTFPFKEIGKEKPKAILGGFDISARPFVESDFMSLAMPAKVFAKILADMDDAFLETKSWQRVLKRIHLHQKKKDKE